MALLHQAQLQPSKLELLNGWVFGRDWFTGDLNGELSNIASYRFDDPANEVGVETIMVRAGNGPTLQIPLTYRGAPLEGAENSLIGTMEHSVLGKRWVYDGAGDPVYLQTVASAVLNGGHQAELYVETAEGRVPRTPNALVWGTGVRHDPIETPSVADVGVRQEGSVTIVDAGDLHVRIQRVMGGDALGGKGPETRELLAVDALTGTWTDSDEPQELVLVTSA